MSGNEVLPLERAVASFPVVYLLRLGLALTSEDGLQLDTADAVRTCVESGGNLEVTCGDAYRSRANMNL